MQQNYDIVVVGSGLVGSAFVLDIAVRAPKLKIAILELKPLTFIDLDKELDSRIYAISPQNLDYLAMINGLPNTSRMGVIKTMDVSGDKNSNLLLKSEAVYHPFLARTVESTYLQQYIYTQILALDNVELIYGMVEDIIIDNNLATIKCIDKSYTCTLVVGSDGANSKTRELGDFTQKEIAYDQYGLVANFACESPHKNVAYEWFHQSNTMAYLPLPGNNISIVWSHKESQSLLLDLDADSLSHEVAASGYHKLGKLTLLGKPAVFPLKLRLVDKFYNQNIVLIGDAAHTIHPLAGQGVNLGFGDAKVLADILVNVKNYQIGDVELLAKYNVLRMPEVRKMQLTCHGLYSLFDLKSGPLFHLRNIGLNLVNRLPIIKNGLINNAIA